MNNICVVDKITLNIPEVDLQPDVNELCSSPETVEKLEQCVMNWQTNITVVLEEQQHKKPQVGDSARGCVGQALLEGGIHTVTAGSHMNHSLVYTVSA